MRICGFNKLTLLDFPGLTACTLFTEGCNFLCPFCHNSQLVNNIQNNQFIDEDEIFSFLKKRKGVIEGVCISGGEPTLQKDIIDFITKIKKLGYLVKLDTNGSNPEILKTLLTNKLVDYVAMDIKNAPSKYEITCGKSIVFNNVLQSIEIIKNFAPKYEFRTTIVKEFHDEKSIHELGKFMENCPNYYLQNFEDSGNLIQENLHSVEPKVMKTYKDILVKYGIKAKIRGI